jgi:hypothetical protein
MTQRMHIARPDTRRGGQQPISSLLNPLFSRVASASMLERIAPRNSGFEREAHGVAKHVAQQLRLEAANTQDTPTMTRISGAAHGTTPAPILRHIVKPTTETLGHAMNPAMREDMEHRLGYRFGDVLLHTGPAAHRANHRLQARAFTHGRHIVLSDSAPPLHSPDGQALLAHELTHVVQQRMGGSHLVQRDAIADVEDKLSYGLFDWAVTDQEAVDALALLAAIPAAKLGTELARLDRKYVDRLLDNLPDAAKSGDGYQRVITALGSAGVTAYAEEQLSYGLFDWAVTDADVARFFNLFTTLPHAEQGKLLVSIRKAGKYGRLLDNMSIGHYSLHIIPWINGLTAGRLSKDERDLLHEIVLKAPADPIDTLKAATSARYDVVLGPTTITGYTAVAWNAEKLRETYLSLEHLPDAHVARNKVLTRFGQFSQGSRTLADGTKVQTTGVYNQGKKELAANLKADDLAPTLVHETGHAVDAEMGWSIGPEPAKAERGGWKEYASHAACATDMVDDANDGIKKVLTAAQRSDVESNMATAMTNRSAATLEVDIKARAWFPGLKAAEKTKVLGDKSLKAIPIGLQDPWFTAANGGEHLGIHVYQESYTPTWVRYQHAARARMVDKYQFRDSSEWFAECYAAYYDPSNTVKGERLNRADPNTKTYFDNVVDKRAPSR